MWASVYDLSAFLFLSFFFFLWILLLLIYRGATYSFSFVISLSAIIPILITVEYFFYLYFNIKLDQLSLGVSLLTYIFAWFSFEICNNTYHLMLSLSLMTENTWMQLMQAVINKLIEQSEGCKDQLTAITQALASLQGQLGQRIEHSPRHSSSPFASPRYSAMNL